jgi:SAM-dependent methyltransferase
VLGIEPATNIARVAQEERGIPTLSEFFGPALAAELSRQGKRADIIHANNVLAHVADLNGFVNGLASLLKDDGVAVIEVPYVKDMIDRTEFDTIYHEHLCYFSLTALGQLFRRHGLAIQDVERLPIHGGTLRLFALKESAAREQSPSSSALQLLADEQVWAGEFEYYRGFRESVDRLRNDLVTLLRDLKADGKTIAVYGASAKGTTLLSYSGIGTETLDYVVDRSTAKQGFYTPGAHLPIYAPEHLHETMPDYLLLLTWNFAVEILEQQSEYRRRGGRFIIPIPKVQVVEPNAGAAEAPAGE